MNKIAERLQKIQLLEEEIKVLKKASQSYPPIAEWKAIIKELSALVSGFKVKGAKHKSGITIDFETGGDYYDEDLAFYVDDIILHGSDKTSKLLAKLVDYEYYEKDIRKFAEETEEYKAILKRVNLVKKKIHQCVIIHGGHISDELSSSSLVKQTARKKFRLGA
jgi:hypothetical protein